MECDSVSEFYAGTKRSANAWREPVAASGCFLRLCRSKISIDIFSFTVYTVNKKWMRFLQMVTNPYKIVLIEVIEPLNYFNRGYGAFKTVL